MDIQQQEGDSGASAEPPDDLRVEKADSSSRIEEEDEDDFVEVDPTDRYGRYSEVLGKGACKTVFRAFDKLNGIEVAWYQIRLVDLTEEDDKLKYIHSEIRLLKMLRHRNIIKMFTSWFDEKQGMVNFITELFYSGTLREYRRRHKQVDLRAVKRWATQILRGLQYLHRQNPPVIHRDLKCDNIFVNGNSGEIKIGDLGLAMVLKNSGAPLSVHGTPEFMAPELYLEDYNELVDIYAFGMCVLEMITLEFPYSECKSIAQIYKKVIEGVPPLALNKVNDSQARLFIESCIAPVSKRLSAKQLLTDPFLRCSSTTRNEMNRKSAIKWRSPGVQRDVKVSGELQGGNFLNLCFRIAESSRPNELLHVRTIKFAFDLESDTPWSVAKEMVEELNFPQEDMDYIASEIGAEIAALAPHYVNKGIDHSSESDKEAVSGVAAPAEETQAMQIDGGSQNWCMPTAVNVPETVPNFLKAFA